LLQAEAVVAWEQTLATVAAIVGTFEPHQAERRLKGLGSPAGIPSHLPAWTSHRRTRVIGRVGVDAAFDHARCHGQSLSASSHLDGFKVQIVCGALAYKCFDFGADLRVKDLAEAPLLPRSSEVISAAASMAWQSRSLISTNSRTKLRNLRYSAIWPWVCSTATGGMT
jgi:hypothetical protein